MFIVRESSFYKIPLLFPPDQSAVFLGLPGAVYVLKQASLLDTG